MQVFYARHVCRLDPMPKDVTDTFAKLAEDPTVYYTMCVWLTKFVYLTLNVAI